MKEDKGKENLSKGDELSHLDPEWIKKGLHSNDICLNWVKRFAYHLAVSSMKEDKRDHVQEKGKFKYNQNGKPIFRKELSTNQLRKFFGEMKRLQAQEFDENGLWLAEFRMLKPKLAYAVGKDTSINPKIIDFYQELEIGINAVSNKVHFKNFVQLVEAIVAYHKYFEKNKKYIEDEQD
jgi:CRISPR-associated protein Csm2